MTQLGRTEEVLPQLKRAVEIKPELPEAQTDLGNYYFGQGKHENAIQHYQLALRTRPDFFNAAHNLPIAQAALGRFADATDSAEKALKLAEAMGNAAMIQQLTQNLQSYLKQATSAQSDLSP